jgi:hypothetical protein
MVPTLTKLRQLEALIDTEDLNPWQTRFVQENIQRVSRGIDLSEKQIETLDALWSRHFA